jgi:membrane protein implicated in regulation of membrane protease activity
MYGYDPRQRGPESGSWGEVFAFVRAAMSVILPIIGVLIGMLAALLATLALGQIHAALALIPFALLGGAVTWYVRRERRETEATRKRLTGPRP